MTTPSLLALALQIVADDPKTKRCCHVQGESICTAPASHGEGMHTYESAESIIPFA